MQDYSDRMSAADSKPWMPQRVRDRPVARNRQSAPGRLDPRGEDIWRERSGGGCSYPASSNRHSTDGILDLVQALREDRPPTSTLEHDLHLIDILDAAAASRANGVRPRSMERQRCRQEAYRL